MKWALGFFLIGLTLLVHNSSGIPSPRIDSKLLEKLSKDKTANVIIHLRGGKVSEVREKFLKMKITSREAQGNTLYQMLKSNADTSQERILAHLEKHRASHEFEHTQLWIINAIIVKGINKEMVKELARNYPEIETINLERIIPLLDAAKPSKIHTLSEMSLKAGRGTSFNWGLDTMNAPAANLMGCDGRGVIIGITDTGCRCTHMCTKDSYRGYISDDNYEHNYNWFDPMNGKTSCSDDHGHGTHVTSLACGACGMGVAPNAKWIHSKGCDGQGCPDTALLRSGQWMACPTDVNDKYPNCDLRPHIVSNSWGGGQNDPWYNDVISGWIAFDMVPLFAAGNDGATNDCSKICSPGDCDDAWAIAATDENDKHTYWSGTGPGVDPTKENPLCSACGNNIPGAWPTSDKAYAVLSGTSMATPMAAGAVASYKSCKPGATMDKIKYDITTSAYKCDVDSYCSTTGTPTYNFINGHGRLDCVAALNVT